MNDGTMSHDAPDPRAAVVRTLVARETERLERRFGTAWSIRGGHALHNATHSRSDVVEATTELGGALAQIGLLAPEAVPLAQLAAIFHAHGGVCGDGAGPAITAMRRWPALFDVEDQRTVVEAIHGVRCAENGVAPRQRTAHRLGTGLTYAALGGMPTVDVVCAILADADRAHLGQPQGLHRILLRMAEQHAARRGLPNGSDGRDAGFDPELLGAGLEDAADALDRHRWVLFFSSRRFPLRADNAARTREAIARVRRGELTWGALVAQADRSGGRPWGSA